MIRLSQVRFQLPDARLQLRDALAAERVDICFPLASLHSAYSTPLTLKSTRATALFVVNAYCRDNDNYA